MSPEGEYRSAKHEGASSSPKGRPEGDFRSAEHASTASATPPSRSANGPQALPHAGRSARGSVIMRVLGWTMAIGLVASVAIVAALFAMAGSVHGGSILIDGEPLAVDALGLGHWAVAIAGVAAALFVVILVVPLAVLLPLAIAAVALIAAAFAVAGVLVALLSPLILLALLAWLVVWLVARSARRSGARSATIPS